MSELVVTGLVLVSQRWKLVKMFICTSYLIEDFFGFLSSRVGEFTKQHLLYVFSTSHFV